MDLYNQADGPALDVGVEKRLKRLDPNLRVTFSRWAIDGLTGQPIIFLGTKQPIEDPAFHVWVFSSCDSRYHLVNSYPAQLGFGHREVARLEADCARTMRPSDLYRMVWTRQQQAQERQKQSARAHKQDVVKANKKRIADLVFEGKSGVRQAKAVSYAGQGKRGTPGEIMTDARSDGWER